MKKPSLILPTRVLVSPNDPITLIIFENKIKKCVHLLWLILCFSISIFDVEAQAPTITSFSPTSGAVGTTVTIIGTNFNTTPVNNIVYFGTVKATVTASTATSITCAVPVGATSITPIIVQNETNGLQASSVTTITGKIKRQFNVTHSPLAFYNSKPFTVGTGPNSTAIGDFNGDGKSDFSVTNYQSATVSVYLGNGAGGFVAGTTVNIDPKPTSIAVGDLNGDGKADFVVPDDSGLIAVYTGDGSGGFTKSASLLIGTSPKDIVIGDFNGDGRADLCTANQDANGAADVRIYRGDGAGGFTTAETLPLGGSLFPTSMAIGDFDGDGKADVVVANARPNNASVCLGDGAGKVVLSSTVRVGSNPASIEIGDFNGDGRLDFATANLSSNDISIRLGDGLGGFIGSSLVNVGLNPNSVAVGDFNGDGNADLATTNGGSGDISIRYGDGDALFSGTGSIKIGTSLASVVIGEFNQDAKADFVVVAPNSNSAHVVIGESNTTITSFMPTSGAVGTSVTISGQGFSTTPESYIVYFGAVKAKVTASTATSITCIVPAGATSIAPITVQSTLNGFQLSTMTTIGGGAAARQFTVTNTPTLIVNASTYELKNTTTSGPVIVADFNNDGKPDYATTTESSDVNTAIINIYLGDGIGGFSPAIPSPIGLGAVHAATGDFNGDGNIDIATANNIDNNIGILLGNGTGGFSKAPSIPLISPFPPAIIGAYFVSTGDFNKDGLADVALAYRDINSVRIYLGNGKGEFSLDAEYVGYGRIEVVSIGDFNGDGKADFAALSTDDKAVRIRLGDGSGKFPVALSGVVFGENISTVVIADFNGDGKADLVVGGELGIYPCLGDGNGAFTISKISNNPSRRLVVADFNGDGKADVANTEVSIFLGNGNGTFSAPYTIATGGNLIAANDFDGDDKADFIANGRIGIHTAPPPVITLLPAFTRVNDEITITGTNFSKVLTNNQISIGGKTVFAKSATITEIKVDTPLGVFGNVEVQVTVSGKPSNKPILPILPAINDFSPTTGYIGDIVSIVGSGFSSVKADNEISFGTIVVPAVDVRSASINALSVKVPNGAKGVLPIKVKVGTQTGVSATNFAVKGTEIQDFAPQEAYIGDKVNLLGAGFSSIIADNEVFFGTVQATVVSASNNLLVVEVPTGISGSLPISLKLFGDTYLASPDFKLKASEITEISPEEGFASETVSIIGNGFFSTVTSENVVLFGTTPATVSKASLTSLSVIIPSGISGSLPVSVTKGGEKVDAPKPFTIKTVKFTDINPSTGYSNDIVSLIGEGFSSTIGNNKVSFGTVNAEITKASKNSLTVKVPKMKIGEVDVSVISAGFAIPEKQKFTVRGTGITDVIPLIGFTEDNITILGDGFSTTRENNKVFFGTFAAEVISASRTSMTVRVPKDAKGEVSVLLNLDKEKYEAPKPFKANVITVDAIIPASGKVGDIITITGFGFDKNAKVLIGGKEATITFSDPNKLNVKVPEGIFGEVEVLVEARGDRQKGTFLIRAIIDGFEPLSGFAKDKITFTGSGLNPDLSKNVILIGDKKVEIIRESFANNKFSVLIPKGVGGSVSVTVNGEILPNNLVVLTQVNNISPKEGIEGTEVTIFGTGFSPELNNNTVSFNDVNVIPFEVKDDFLKVRVPSGISGEIGITLRVRASRTVSVIDNFGVIPQIKGIAPEKAPTNAEVSIIGTSFSEIRAENRVLFGDKQATVISARNTELKVRVPSGNGKVPVVVNVSKQKSNVKDFEISSEIKVVTPNGREFLAYNSNFSITFTSSFDDDFKIELIGEKEVITIATLKNNERAFTWLVPSFIEKGENYKIKISSLGEIKTSDESDAVFSIGSEALDTKITTLYPPSIDYQSNTPLRLAIEVGTSLQGLEGAVFYKPFSSKNYKKVGVVSTGNSYFVLIPFSEFDQAGLEYYFELYRGGRLQAKSVNGRTVIKYPNLEIPYTNFGKNTENYEMISIPLKLQDDKVTDVFKDELGVYNIKQWRTFRYDRGSNTEFAGGTVNVGEAFWLIIKDNPNMPLMTGAGSTIETSTEISRMHSIKARKGWNQIGNPYLFALDFDNLKAANKNLGTSSLVTFEKGSYVESKQLKPFQGGFVFVENDGDLKFPPAPFDASSGGRTEENDFTKSSLNSDTWQVKLNLLSSSTPVRFQTRSGTADRYSVGGFGMHPSASTSKDEFDQMTPPRFFEHLEINFLRKDYFYPYFSKDIVPTQENYVWEFSVESNTEGNYKTLSWDNSAFGSEKGLVLFDIEKNIKIDMSKENAYTFELNDGKKNFKIYFGDERFLKETVLPEVATVVAYPNPSVSEDLKFNISLPEKSKVYLQVFNSLGQNVHDEEREFEVGFNVWSPLSVSSRTPHTNGVYFYQIQISSEKGTQTVNGKLVKE